MGGIARCLVRFPAVVGLSAALLTGCGGEVLTHHIANDRQAARSFYTYASANQTTFLNVHGLSASEAEVLAAGLPVPSDLPPTRFVITPGAAAHPDYRVVLVLSAPSGMDGADACALPPAGPGGPASAAGVSGNDSLQAAYCYRDRALSQVRVSGLEADLRAAVAPGGGGVAAVRASLARMMQALLPADDDGLRCSLWRGC